MFNPKSAVTASSIIVGLVIAAASIKASDNISRTTHLTFSQPVALPGITLAAGTYIFELAAPFNNLDIVQVLSKDRTKVYWMNFTELVDRPESVGDDTAVTLGEARPGDPRPITVWYPQDDPSGRRFLYRDR